MLFYEEEGGDHRDVQVYLWPADGKAIDLLKATLIQQGEPVEDVQGIPDAAIYQPQRGEALGEKKDKSGEVLWLTIAVHNAASADTKRFAVELGEAGRGQALIAGRLKPRETARETVVAVARIER